MYYRLDTAFNFPACLPNDEENIHETLMSGIVADESDLTLPWPFSMSCDNDPDMRLGDFYSSCNLMSERLVETLLSCGVDNLQIFPALITHKCTGKIIDTYKVVNVLGLVSAANMGASKSQPLADNHYFEKLAIDKSRARDLLIFRLEESPIEILVHEIVARKIQQGNFVDVSLEPTSDT
jgi:hypothetical protein